MTITRPHWSYSALSQYLRCPLQYYFQRVLRLPSPSISSGLALGSVVHAVLADYHNRLRNRTAIEINSVLELFSDHWKRKEATNQIQFRDGESQDDTIAQGIHLVELYLREPPPENIAAVEETFLVPLQNSRGDYLETPLVAVIDLLTSQDGTLKVHEFKTSGRSYSETEVTSSLQPTCYVQAVKESMGLMPAVEYTVLVKTKTPKLQRLQTQRSYGDCHRLGDLVETIQHAIDSKIFYPVENPLNCSGCSYRAECRNWRPETDPEHLVSLEVPQDLMAC